MGLYHFRHRSYSPRLGRWLQPDPAGYPDGVNLFEYVRSNPITGFDPWGLEDTKKSDKWDFDEFDKRLDLLAGPKPKPAYEGTADLFKRGTNLPGYDAYRQGLDKVTEYAKSAAEIGLPIGNALDLYAAVTGKDLFTGEQLSVGGRVVAGLGAALGTKRVAKALEFVSNKGRRGRKCVVAPSRAATRSSAWTRAEFNGTRFYQRGDLINPNLIDKQGRTNLQRMQDGLAPLGPDGKSITLHHMLQTADGPIAEVTQTFHQAYSKAVHINPNTIPSGIDRAAFDTWREKYWINRANDFVPR